MVSLEPEFNRIVCLLVYNDRASGRKFQVGIDTVQLQALAFRQNPRTAAHAQVQAAGLVFQRSAFGLVHRIIRKQVLFVSTQEHIALGLDLPSRTGFRPYAYIVNPSFQLFCQRVVGCSGISRNVRTFHTCLEVVVHHHASCGLTVFLLVQNQSHMMPVVQIVIDFIFGRNHFV